MSGTNFSSSSNSSHEAMDTHEADASSVRVAPFVLPIVIATMRTTLMSTHLVMVVCAALALRSSAIGAWIHSRLYAGLHVHDAQDFLDVFAWN